MALGLSLLVGLESVSVFGLLFAAWILVALHVVPAGLVGAVFLLLVEFLLVGLVLVVVVPFAAIALGLFVESFLEFVLVQQFAAPVLPLVVPLLTVSVALGWREGVARTL